ncbi:hypothetical protein PYW07_009214 [Mythimna separata]|uniref:Protease inhibitor n=1 Tax=Mythimna separata TaxID=271217 RepID=A0AAD8DM59_MYTSE|nr:hypothetical protein PYW07_009214 [Mythimna separata]
MKVLVALCVLTIVTLSYSSPLTQECYYDDRGLCSGFCEEGTHSYTTGCGPVTPEATCDNPNPIAGKGDVCDYSDCYCNAPTVRDTVSGKCVNLEDCPKKEEKKEENAAKA